jgi:hypothetical protein
VIGNRFPGIGEQVDQEPVNRGPKISSDSISTNSYNIKRVPSVLSIWIKSTLGRAKSGPNIF